MKIPEQWKMDTFLRHTLELELEFFYDLLVRLPSQFQHILKYKEKGPCFQAIIYICSWAHQHNYVFYFDFKDTLTAFDDFKNK